MTSDSTDTRDGVPWEGPPSSALAAPHLALCWSLDEPTRVGEVAPLTGPASLGRGTVPAGGPLARVVFYRQRPAGQRPMPPLEGSRLSRHQLELTPRPDGRIEVVNVGRCKLFVNGVEKGSAVVAAGDVLRLNWALVLLVTSRPSRLTGFESYPEGRHFDFGMVDPDGIVGESPRTWRLRDDLAFAANSREHVLLVGPTGAGKELAARAIHELSNRRKASFVARNAATLPDALIDAELFGNVKDYPNAGMPLRTGIIAEADGGTLFLDEIGELPLSLQAHLLRVLDSGGEYQRLGEAKNRRSDLRLLAATNRNIDDLRPDFAARLKLRVQIPDIGQRREDIPLLIRELLERIRARDEKLQQRFFEKRGGAWCARLSPELVEALMRHEYVENVRELERVLLLSMATSRATFLALTREVRAELADGRPAESLELTRAALVDALATAEGNIAEAARRLGLKNRYALYRLMKKHGLERPGESS